MAESWKHDFVEANGIRFHYVTAGEGPLVVLLHGFPQFWYAWRHQIPALAAAGWMYLFRRMSAGTYVFRSDKE